MKPRFEGKVAIVTGAGCVGAGWGNGRAAAVRLAEEGARVLALDRDADRLQETLALAGAAAAAIETFLCDVTDSASVAAAVERCVASFGTVDILVNNVGGSAAGGPVEMDEEVWDAQVDFNLKSVFLTCKHVLPVMLARRSGAIVNVASTSGLRWTGSAQVAYAATKAGVIQLSRVVAVQHAAQGVRVNCLLPGATRSAMSQRWADRMEGGETAMSAAIPMQRLGTPDEQASVAVFLLSDAAAYMTGASVVVLTDGMGMARARLTSSAFCMAKTILSAFQ